MCSCTPPGTSQVYGQTMPILTARSRPRRRRHRRTGHPARRRPPARCGPPGPHRSPRGPARRLRRPSAGRPSAASAAASAACAVASAAASRARSRSAVNTRWSMCQSSGCASNAGLEDPGHLPASSPATFSRRVPSSGTGISSWMCAYPSGPSNHSVTGIRAAPVCTASAAAPPIIVRLLAEEVHLDAAAGDVPVGGQADQAARAQPLGEDPEPRHAAGRGEHLEPQPLPEGEEPPGQRLGLEPLGHGGELRHAAGDDPGTGLVPVAHVRQRRAPPRARRRAPRAAAPRPGRSAYRSTSRSVLITGSRKTSNQYRA